MFTCKIETERTISMSNQSTRIDEVARSYAILRLNPGCTRSELKKRHKALVRQFHPDRFQGDSAAQDECTRTLRQINRAYDVVSQALGGGPSAQLPFDYSDAAQAKASGADIDVRSIETSMERTSMLQPVADLLRWLLPFGASFVLIQGHGRESTDFIRPASTLEVTAAAVCAAFGLAEVVRQYFRRR